MENAIALLEVQAMVTAIVGLDAMVKTADVKLIHVEKRLGGRLVTVVVEGSVSAVTAALEAGVEAAKTVGNVACAEVIARPHADIVRFIKTDKGTMNLLLNHIFQKSQKNFLSTHSSRELRTQLDCCNKPKFL